MKGIESVAGIDKLATSIAMNSTKIPPEQRNDLRELLCGCVWTQKREHSKNLSTGLQTPHLGCKSNGTANNHER